MNYEKSNVKTVYSNNNSNNDNNNIYNKKYSNGNGIEHLWNNYIMERFIKANLFIICCVAAALLLIAYLAAFSCEISWILEAKGDLPISAYILCTQYFVIFVATSILIHGLVTGLNFGLFAWSIIIGCLSIPELVFVMIMTTQHWGLQSVHGLTELISYLVRLIINCFALICVVPTALKWRRESQVLTQLQDLATRLQLQTPPPSVPSLQYGDVVRASTRLNPSAFENAAYQLSEQQQQPQQKSAKGHGADNEFHSQYFNNNDALFNSQNEFNASLFRNPYNFFDNDGNMHMFRGKENRAQSLMDLRCTLPGLYNPRYAIENGEDNKNAKYFNITLDDLKNNLQHSSELKQMGNSSRAPSLIGSSVNDPIYCSIESKPPPPPLPPPVPEKRPGSVLRGSGSSPEKQTKMRNCISLENLDGIAKFQNDMTIYGNNLLQNYTRQQQQYIMALLHGQYPMYPLYKNLSIYRQPTTPTATMKTLTTSGQYRSALGYQHGSPSPLESSVPMQLPPLSRRGSDHLQYYSGFGYVNYTNPYITANSKLSLGNESDDYRKYRDVAL